jgi:hypothetical protein
MILAITKYPEAQVKARKQIDAVCGTERYVAVILI